jgi:mannose-1-phosphate guanylyltransferase
LIEGRTDGRTYAVVLAGGSGTRLWPLSRSRRPKQLLTLHGATSLLRTTVDRILPLVAPERVLIMTEHSHAADIAKELPDIPRENIFIEPARRGTAGALALAAAAIEQRQPDAVMVSVHSDAFVGDAYEFRRTLAAAFEAADTTRNLVLLGIAPSFAATNLGYIESGEEQGRPGGYALRRVNRFTERPPLETARHYLRSGRHFWNMGTFVWRVDVIRREFERLQPEIATKIAEIAPHAWREDRQAVLDRIYPGVKSESIDRGILEPSDRVAVIPSTFPWSDIGTWSEIYKILPKDEDGNAGRGVHHSLGTRNTLVFAESGRAVATIGLEDIVVIDTPDAVLVFPRSQDQEVGKLVQKLALDEANRPLL